jgi:hypothetical protein
MHKIKPIPDPQGRKRAQVLNGRNQVVVPDASQLMALKIARGLDLVDAQDRGRRV